VAREKVVRQQPDNFSALANHDFGIEGKPAFDIDKQLRSPDWLPDYKGARRSDVDGIKVLQLLREHSGSKGSVTTDVDTSQKNDECHLSVLLSAQRSASAAGAQRE